jgi:putative NADPH-quinone reductase
MAQSILIIQGHPDVRAIHFCHALADAYAEGATAAGRQVRRLTVAGIDFPLLRSKEEWDTSSVPAGIRASQAEIAWADHIVIVYPLWLGSMPAVLKAFLEQVARPGFAIGAGADGGPKPLLTGKSARILVTMGMPALVYRWYFGAHSLKSLERNILAVCGIKPIRESLVGSVDSKNPAARAKWLDRMREMGRKGR